MRPPEAVSLGHIVFHFISSQQKAMCAFARFIVCAGPRYSAQASLPNFFVNEIRFCGSDAAQRQESRHTLAVG